MTNLEIIKGLSKRLGKNQTEVKEQFHLIFSSLCKIIDKYERLSIPNLGTFAIKTIKKRKSFDPYRKIYNLLPERRIIKFYPNSQLKEEIKNLEE